MITFGLGDIKPDAVKSLTGDITQTFLNGEVSLVNFNTTITKSVDADVNIVDFYANIETSIVGNL